MTSKAEHWRKGGVTVTAREDGTVHVYAPDPDRVLSSELALELTRFLFHRLALGVVGDEEKVTEIPTVEVVDPPVSVPSGEITVSPRGRGRPRKSG